MKIFAEYSQGHREKLLALNSYIRKMKNGKMKFASQEGRKRIN